ncbi:putative bifunctional diguanylate cyclase/phosphodiesterase [Stutzerimonas tarimensis]|uniref:Bifunctional diguanylate cyclase/phosphodiesterase n=1 Tax=Stutzerimonas tarimensis TaxID=1507735 RepID=A0ABV7T4Y7_9GAMM
MKQQLRNRLSLKLLRVVLLATLSVGFVLSLAQIVFDSYQTHQLIEADAQRILRMARGPATQAIYSLDREMGTQVMEGLFEHEAMRYAAIGHPDEESLAEKIRPLANLPARWLTDPILAQERTFSIALIGREPKSEYYGDLDITLDTAVYGEAFLHHSLVIVVVGVARALILGLILYLIYQWLLTRPLQHLVEHLVRINPDHPSQHKLPLFKGHEDNELGLWVKTANGLLASIERNLRLRREAEDDLQRMSQYDLLTGLPNRQQLQERLAPVLTECRKQQQRIAVLCIGLDDFKGINERFSYLFGDQLLVALTERLRVQGGQQMMLARLGGDEFALVQPGIAQPYEAAELADRILEHLETPFVLQQRTVRLRATIGITLFPEDGETAEKLLQKAEQTMTLAKQRSRSRYQFYVADLDSRIRQRRELQEELAEALTRQQFHLVYQPQLDLAQQRIVGVEALLRWRLPHKGLIPPDLFIPLAEENGSIIRIGEWVLDQACRQLRRWHDDGLTGLRMAVNLSTVQLYHESTPKLIGDLLRRYGLPAESLEVEVTETVLMEDIDSAATILHRLRDAGALIAIDDFGTGYSSLSYLKSLPVDKIKIDKSFVRDLSEDEDDSSIVRAVIQLGTSLGMRVVAEGVESRDQERFLIAQGCHEVQGYLYSKPLPSEELEALLQPTTQIG